MPNDNNNETAMPTEAIQLPDRSQDIENPPEPVPSKPDEHVPPLEVPGREQTPLPTPEKGNIKSFVYPALVKNGKKRFYNQRSIYKTQWSELSIAFHE